MKKQLPQSVESKRVFVPAPTCHKKKKKEKTLKKNDRSPSRKQAYLRTCADLSQNKYKKKKKTWKKLPQSVESKRVSSCLCRQCIETRTHRCTNIPRSIDISIRRNIRRHGHQHVKIPTPSSRHTNIDSAVHPKQSVSQLRCRCI